MDFKKIPASKLSSLKLDVTDSFEAKNSSTISIKPILLKASFLMIFKDREVWVDFDMFVLTQINSEFRNSNKNVWAIIGQVLSIVMIPGD